MRRKGPPKKRRAKSLPKATPTPPKTAFQQELTTKRRGEISELAFALAASRRGFVVSKPFGDCQRYDVILDIRKNDPELEPTNDYHLSRPRLVRVQVKSSTQMIEGQYRINSGRRLNKKVVPYRLSEVDFIVAYIIPEDAWFILPLPHVLGQVSLLFRPKGSKTPGVYDAYREAWHHLTEPDGLEIV